MHGTGWHPFTHCAQAQLPGCTQGQTDRQTDRQSSPYGHIHPPTGMSIHPSPTDTPSACFSIYLPTGTAVQPSICPPTRTEGCPPVCPPPQPPSRASLQLPTHTEHPTSYPLIRSCIHGWTSIRSSASPFINPSICTQEHLSVRPSIYLFIHPSTHP